MLEATVTSPLNHTFSSEIINNYFKNENVRVRTFKCVVEYMAIIVSDWRGEGIGMAGVKKKLSFFLFFFRKKCLALF